MVAATDRGVCFVQIGAADRELLARLRREFPQAEIDDLPSALLDPLARVALAVADATPLAEDFPVDIRGTAFQWRVWRALTQIPRGQTRSYSEVAAAIGQPSATRAVARACATNPLALVVPCHRVVGAKGELTGYRWGAHVKRALLDKERAR
jgi:AraC family transcriptional regulator of adaptative response/methylated-DNA-[protein]-cysteine methyltransferase